MPVESLYKIDHFASCVSVLCAQSGWKRARAGTVVEVEVTGRLVMNDLATKLTALLASGELVQILADWAEERFPLYAYHPSRHLPPAKVRAFLDFVVASIPPTSKKGPATRLGKSATAGTR